MNQSNSLAIILAAGRGTRMKSQIPKPLMHVNKKPILYWLIEDFKKNNIDISVVINPEDKDYFRDLSNQVFFVFQNKPKGTGHAVQQAVELFDKYNYIYVFVGDCPYIGKENIALMLDEHIKKNNDITILSAIFKQKQFPYARIIRNKEGVIKSCIEELDATSEQKKIQELFGSHYLFKSDILEKYLFYLTPNIKSKEIYFTDIINELIKDKKEVCSLLINDWRRLVGLNTKEDIEWIESQNMI